MALRSLFPFEEIERYSMNRVITIGVDEVGRGCLAGPVVAAAVMFDWQHPERVNDLALQYPIRDSKTLRRKQRAEIAAAIRAIAIGIGIGEVDAKTIDDINILQATLRAMRIAVDAAVRDVAASNSTVYPDHKQRVMRVLVDGNQTIPELKFDQQTVVQGDAKIFSIAAASIVAKEYRDAMMERFDDEFPGYNFSSHKGYGTLKHCDAIRSRGLTSIHRKTFWHE
jgi:ribonuclease HII